jgi:RNA polymerase sigma-70 factor (ECF subfamily)
VVKRAEPETCAAANSVNIFQGVDHVYLRRLQYNGRFGVSPLPVRERGGGVAPSAPAVMDDDEGLVHALLQRDPEAPAALFDRYAPYIQRVIAKMVGYSEPERPDLLHDVFVRALERIGDLKNPKALKSWMVGVAVLVTKEWLRRRRRVGPPVTPQRAAERAGPSAPPEAIEALQSLHSLLDRLSEDDRAVFVLRFLEGMNLNEIAEGCDLSISTARRRVMRAENRFRTILPSFPALFERLKKGGQP